MEASMIIQKVSQDVQLRPGQVTGVMDLVDEGCTVPFIARYRKERTGNLDEVAIQNIIEAHNRVTELEKRRDYILQFLEENGKLTPELQRALRGAATMAELEDLYLPYKPRKKTLADKARELGLEPLAALIKEKNLAEAAALKHAAAYVKEGVPDAAAALEHALNIIVQEYSDEPAVRRSVRARLQEGVVACAVKRGKKEEGQKYRDYFDCTEDLKKMPSHRIMAVLRGSDEGFLNVAVEPREPLESIAAGMADMLFRKRGELVLRAAGESLKRHLVPSLGNELLKEARARAELDSLAVFARNLEKILLSPPFGERAVIGIDPGIRTGCKAAVLGPSGEFLEYLNLQLHHEPGEVRKLLPLIEKYHIDGIAVGNGTFGRESYKIIREAVVRGGVVVALVDEDGASVYSAGETAREEFPELDVTVRGAISIGRRFQDPLAELVKIEPRALGVGQYQHDITAALLKEALQRTVEWAVNRVGVNINTAGYHLLSYISGLDRNKAREIIRYRTEKKRIASREDLKKIKGIGEKAFQQAAGFLRVRDGENLLDATGVHPESYDDVRRIAEHYRMTIEDLVANPEKVRDEVREKLAVRELDSIIAELKNRGMDPRSEFNPVAYSDELQSMEDLREGMICNGVVDNVVSFGAFVDLGIKERGLVHISEVSQDYLADINTALAVGQQVRVKVVSIDRERKRIGLSIRQAAQ